MTAMDRPQDEEAGREFARETMMRMTFENPLQFAMYVVDWACREQSGLTMAQLSDLMTQLDHLFPGIWSVDVPDTPEDV